MKMNEPITDKELIVLIKKSPSQGISLALDLYGGSVKTICSMILFGFSEGDIEESISDTFTALWRSIDHYDISKNASVKSYLYGIARKTALNRKRSLSKYYVIDINEIDNPPTNNLETECVEVTVANQINSELIYDAVMEMKSPDKEIFIHRYFLDEKIRTISELLQIKEKTVENRLARGKAKLKLKLIERGIIDA